jgi:F-type H+-transporting ATPase subunit epsilon
MADKLHLRVLTPERQLVDAEVREVTAPGALGEIGILPDHAALVTALEPGVLSYPDTGGKVVRITVGAGFAEVRDNVVTVLAESGTIQTS